MLIYHASYTVIDAPDVVHSRKNLDFGRGFYATVIREQAVIDACLKFTGYTQL